MDSEIEARFSKLTSEQREGVKKLTVRLRFLYESLKTELQSYLSKTRVGSTGDVIGQVNGVLGELERMQQDLVAAPESLPTEETMRELERKFQACISSMSRTTDVQ